MVWRESQRCGDRVGGSVDAGSGRKNCRWKGRGFDSRGDHAFYKHAHLLPREVYDYNSPTTHVLQALDVFQWWYDTMVSKSNIYRI